MPDDPTPDDPTEAAVRRLLADARHTEPMPPEIADRLDQVLADLGSSRPAPRSEPAVVVPLASRASRRRRRLATGLVAAAAVVVVGVTLSGLAGGLDGLTSESNDSAQEAGAREYAGSGDDEGSLRDQGESMEESAPAAAPSTGTVAPDDGDSEPRIAPLTVRPDRFELDALAARQQAGAAFDSLTDLGCGGVPLEGQTVTLVRYADRQGYLVFGVGGADGRQRVDLFLCPEGELERRALIPAP